MWIHRALAPIASPSAVTEIRQNTLHHIIFSCCPTANGGFALRAWASPFTCGFLIGYPNL